ncbi:MAG: type I phosphomannose isomerase catalytic subunit [Chloroflexota bacterium]
MTDKLYPMMMTPTLHVKVWGGRKLETKLGKTLFGDSPYGESWELHDTCTIGNGAYAGQELSDVIAERGADILGEGFDPNEGLPLLVKLLDANEWLSVQVHPNDEQAKTLEGEPRGKTEAWIVLAADPAAQLVIGITPGTDQDALADAIRDDTIESMLEYAMVEKDDVLYMPANTVHAIGPGLLIYEVQQSSNTTYRLYDWGRTGLDGKPRDLHIEKGVQVSNLEKLPDVTRPEGELLVDGDYFQTKRLILDSDTKALDTEGVFHSLTCIDGVVTIQHTNGTIDITMGQTALVPAGLGAYDLMGTGTVLLSHMVRTGE